MPIDASIPLALVGRNAPQIDLVTPILQVEQLRGAQQRRRLGELQLTEAERAATEGAALRDVYARAAEAETLGTPEGQPQLLRDIAKVSPQGYLAERQRQTQERTAERTALKAELDLRKTHFEFAQKRTEYALQLLGGTTNQASYDRAKALAAQALGADAVAALPELYDPKVVDELRQQNLSSKEQLDQAWRENELARKQLEEEVMRAGRVETRRQIQAVELPGQKELAREHGAIGAEKQAAGQIRAQEIAINRYLNLEEAGKVGVPIGTRMADLAAKGITPPPATEGQGLSLGYGVRAKDADRIAQGIEATVPEVSSGIQKALTSVPFIGNYLTPEKLQQYNQAKLNFALAILRKESGAAIAKSEYDHVDTVYFPQPGDSAAVIRQKAATRQDAITALATQAGRELPLGAGAPRVTEADIQATIRSSGRSREDVIQALKAKGYTIEGN